jgi:DNA repair protein RecO (recombination protein O)
MSVIERVDMEAAFILHVISYRETSQILDVLTQDHGRISLVANGARRPKSRWRSTLRPFQPFRVSWSGRGSLYTLRAAEVSAPGATLASVSLMAAYYMSELLIALVHQGDPHPGLFTHYAGALAALSAGDDVEPVLRRFELSLLAEIGYGLMVERDVIEDRPLVGDRRYEYVIDRGPVPVPDNHVEGLVFLGSELLALARGEFRNDRQLKSAKRLLRAVLKSNLGDRTLKTRTVFASMRRSLT